MQHTSQNLQRSEALETGVKVKVETIGLLVSMLKKHTSSPSLQSHTARQLHLPKLAKMEELLFSKCKTGFLGLGTFEGRESFGNGD